MNVTTGTVTDTSAWNIASSSDLGIGYSNSVGGSCPTFFNGNIDEVRIFSRALSAEEVGTLHSKNALEKGEQSGAVAGDTCSKYGSSGGTTFHDTQVRAILGKRNDNVEAGLAYLIDDRDRCVRLVDSFSIDDLSMGALFHHTVRIAHD